METINGTQYKFEKLSALSQFHIVRRLAPLIGDVLGVIGNSSVVKDGKKASEMKFDDIDFDSLAKDITPLLTSLSKLPDADVEYTLHNLLKGVSRNSGGGWARVITDTNVIMFEDIKMNLPLMMQLCVHSFKANLQGFLAALPSGLKEGALQSKQIG